MLVLGPSKCYIELFHMPKANELILPTFDFLSGCFLRGFVTKIQYPFSLHHLSHMPKHHNLVRFEVLAVEAMKGSIFWHIKPCSPSKVNWCFGGTCCHYLQGQRISQARNQRESRWQAEQPPTFDASFLFGLFFDPEDGTDMFLQNVSRLSTDYMILYPRRWTHHHNLFDFYISITLQWN
jgi:hypothetical protein